MNRQWSEVNGTDPSSNAVRMEKQTSATSAADSNGTDAYGTWQFRLADTNDCQLLQSGQLGDNSLKVHRVLKNGVYFSTKELRQLSSKQQDLLAEYQSKQLAVVQQCMPVASTYVQVLLDLNDTIAELDVVVALAALAAHRNYVRPTLTDVSPSENQTVTVSQDDPIQGSNGNSNIVGEGIVLKEARHPCVELQESVEFIPNDMNLLFGQSSFLLVTGPNMVRNRE